MFTISISFPVFPSSSWKWETYWTGVLEHISSIKIHKEIVWTLSPGPQHYSTPIPNRAPRGPFLVFLFPKPNPTRTFPLKLHDCGTWVFHHHQKQNANSNSWLVILQLKNYLPIFLIPENPSEQTDKIPKTLTETRQITSHALIP